jgi:solute carrier family 35 protein
MAPPITPLAAAISYGFVSSSMIFLNKMVFADMHFPFPLVVLLLQMLVTAACLPLLATWTGNKIELPRLSSALLTRFLLPSLLYCANVGLGLFSLGALSIPVYQVLKRLTPLASLFLASLILKKRASRGVVVSSLLIVAGSMLVANGDVRFNGAGYALALGSVACQSLYLTLVQRQAGNNASSGGTAGSGDALTSFGVLFVNSVNCIPLLFVATALDGEAAGALAHPAVVAVDLIFIAKLLLLLALGVCLNYLLFLCTILNSALTTCIVGAVKAVAVTVLGFFAFGGQPLTTSMAVGVTANTAGAVLYIFAKRASVQNGAPEQFCTSLRTTSASVQLSGTERPGLVLREPAQGA